MFSFRLRMFLGFLLPVPQEVGKHHLFGKDKNEKLDTQMTRVALILLGHF